MRFLGLDTSCDETSAGVVEADGAGKGRVLSNVVSSQAELHAPYGGVVPEMASRAHAERVAPVVREALSCAGASLETLDGVAVTAGPGLAGALLVGVNFAKGLAWSRGLPLVAVHHIHAHLESVFLTHGGVPLPSLALVVSGGHTALYGVSADEGGRRYARLGATRDDAAGEAFDKAAKMLGLPYPGGPAVERLAREGNPRGLALPRHPKIGRGVNCDFSFSGLKSALARHLDRARRDGKPLFKPDAAASFQEAAVEALVWTARRAARRTRPRSLAVSGGVSVNGHLRERFLALGRELGVPALFPLPELTTDNGAMVAYCGALRAREALAGRALLSLDAHPDWRF